MDTDFQLQREPVVLRPYRAEDAERLYEAARESIAEIFPWLPWCHPDYSLGESQTWIEGTVQAWRDDTKFDFIMNDPASGAFIGGCGLNDISRVNGTTNLGYWVRTGWTGRGVATAATLLLAEFGIKRAGLTRIELVVATGNRASQRVAEKAGATREGVLRNRLLVHDKLHDAVVYSLIPGDLPGTG